MNLFIICYFIITFIVVFLIAMSVRYNYKKLCRKMYIIKSKFKNVLTRYGMLWRYNKVLKKNRCHNFSSEIIFESFVWFYEKHFAQFHVWELNDDEFPRGTKEIIDLYQWIKQVRDYNYNLLNVIDYNKKGITYYGKHFNEIGFMIEEGMLKIFSPKEFDGKKSKLTICDDYDILMFKLRKALYDYDTQICHWIMERRRHIII